MEKELNSVDNKVKFSWKIKWILSALLLALWSSSFSYSQESDSLQNENRYEKIEFKKMDSYVIFEGIEHARQETLKYRNSIFEMIRQLFTKDDRFWFPEFYDICEETENLLKWIENEENALLILNNLKRQLEYDINVEKNVECRLALCKILSIVKDKKNLLNWIVKDPIELLKQNLKVWDVILINKKMDWWDDIWTKALKFYDEKLRTDFWHCLIFAWFDENWDIIIIHSTTETIHIWKPWVERVRLIDYLKKCWCNLYDCVVLRAISSGCSTELLNNVNQKIWSDYDFFAALNQWLWKWNSMNGTYNCAEVIFQSFPIDLLIKLNENDVCGFDESFKWKLDAEINEKYLKYLCQQSKKFQNAAFPNDLFDYPYLFNPVYMSTVEK